MNKKDLIKNLRLDFNILKGRIEVLECTHIKTELVREYDPYRDFLYYKICEECKKVLCYYSKEDFMTEQIKEKNNELKRLREELKNIT